MEHENEVRNICTLRVFASTVCIIFQECFIYGVITVGGVTLCILSNLDNLCAHKRRNGPSKLGPPLPAHTSSSHSTTSIWPLGPLSFPPWGGWHSKSILFWRGNKLENKAICMEEGTIMWKKSQVISLHFIYNNVIKSTSNINLLLRSFICALLIFPDRLYNVFFLSRSCKYVYFPTLPPLRYQTSCVLHECTPHPSPLYPLVKSLQ